VGLFDQFEPTDLGRCGEPFVPRLACTKSYGLWVHGENGTGIAGEMRPQDPWNDAEGIEVGARVEFRYDRFSFALTDYWGYTDTPYVSVLFNYDRNVDPVSGRPRHTNTTDPCRDGTEPACLVPGHAPLKNGETGDVVEIHSINQSLFAWICAGTVGVAPQVDAAACAFTLFNSNNDELIGQPFARGLSAIMSGTGPLAPGDPGRGQTLYSFILGDQNRIVADASDGPWVPGEKILGVDGALDEAFGVETPLVNLNPPNPLVGGLSASLSTQQQALLGCGAFYFTSCDATVPGETGGIDLANTDASVLLQSFPWFEGTKFNPNWDTTDPTLPQPGTVDALFNDGPGGGADAPFSKLGEIETGPAGSRFENGTAYVLPGAHLDPHAIIATLGLPFVPGVDDPFAVVRAALPYVDPWLLDVALGDPAAGGWDPAVDGRVCTLTAGVVNLANCKRHPFTDQIWNSEMAIVSWNLLMTTVALGATDGTTSISTLDGFQPLALGRCSYRQPQYCAFVSGLAAQARNTRNDVRAGGNGRFGRRNFVWASVGDVALRYEKRNIVGLSMDFAEDTTKSSWGVEFTYIDDTFAADNASMSGLTDVDEYNLTLSVDRPTFINFLNANRTFFINSQVFMSYIQGYGNDMSRDGPFTMLLLINANTGYFQDRFLVSTAGVYDFTSQSMAFLPSVQYRFTENFSLTIGAAVLAGKWKGGRDMGVNQFSATADTNLNDTVYVENGISPARDLDNFFLRLRYTF
jgi:hypothetical protein